MVCEWRVSAEVRGGLGSVGCLQGPNILQVTTFVFLCCFKACVLAGVGLRRLSPGPKYITHILYNLNMFLKNFLTRLGKGLDFVDLNNVSLWWSDSNILQVITFFIVHKCILISLSFGVGAGITFCCYRTN